MVFIRVVEVFGGVWLSDTNVYKCVGKRAQNLLRSDGGKEVVAYCKLLLAT